MAITRNEYEDSFMFDPHTQQRMSKEDYMKKILADMQAQAAADAKAKSPAAWNKAPSEQKQVITPGVEVVRKISAPALRFTSPDGKTYVEFKWNEHGVFVVEGNFDQTQLDEMTKQFIGSVIGHMNRILR